MTDPPIRDDGRCAECGRRRPPAAVAHRDPLHSSACARKWHGQPAVLDERRGRRGEEAEMAEAAA